jgi:hypothetical protein
MTSASQDRVDFCPTSLSGPGKRILFVYCALSLFAVFYLPYLLPVSPSTSASYIFGYNNTAGIVLVVLLTATGATWAKGLHLNFAPRCPSPKISLIYLWLALTAELASCLGMWACATHHGTLGEAEYHIRAIELFAQGKTPFVDFEWTYGYGLLAVPTWLAHSLNLDVPDAYFLFWVAASMVGVALLFCVLNMIDFPSPFRTPIFIALATTAILCVPSLGVQYAWLRFVAPLFFILVVYRTCRRPSQPPLPPNFVGYVLAIVFAQLLLELSPEVAIAFVFACSVFLVPISSKLLQRSLLIAYVTMLIGFAAVFAHGATTGVFDSVLDKGHGNNSFPIILAPAPLLYFVVLFIGACYWVQRILKPQIQDNTGPMLIYSLPMIVAVLGRCDPGHILLNGLGVFIPALFYASISPRFWRPVFASFVACFLVITPFFGIVGLALLFRRPAPPPFAAASSIHSLYPTAPPFGGDQILQAPFGYRPNASGFYFSPEIDDGYYEALIDANSPESYRRKIGELAQHPQRDLLLHKDIFDVCKIDPSVERISVGILFAAPYTATAKHTRSIRTPLCDYIRTHYMLAVPASTQNYQYELWHPKTAANSAP